MDHKLVPGCGAGLFAPVDGQYLCDGIFEFGERGRFAEIVVGALLENLVDVFFFGGSGKDDDGNVFQLRGFPDLGEAFKATFQRHVEIEEDHFGGRGYGEVENFHQFPAIVGHHELGFLSHFVESVFKKEPVIGIIVCQENGGSQVSLGHH